MVNKIPSCTTLANLLHHYSEQLKICLHNLQLVTQWASIANLRLRNHKPKITLATQTCASFLFQYEVYIFFILQVSFY